MQHALVNSPVGVVWAGQGQYKAAMILSLILLFCIPWNLCEGSKDTCLTNSGSRCAQKSLQSLCDNQKESNEFVFYCDRGESLEDEELMVDEGKTITLETVGDFDGYGCSFEIRNIKRGVTCCYIHAGREDQRGSDDGLKLCSDLKQPDTCRQSGSGEYVVEEIDGPSTGWCRLTLFDARQSDSGVYNVTFPASPGKYDKEIKVHVKVPSTTDPGLVVGLSIGSVGLALILATVLLVLLVVKPFLEKRDEGERKSDEGIFKKLRKEDFKGFLIDLQGRSVLSLRDESQNNIFHYASRADWNSNMTNMVLDREGKNSGGMEAFTNSRTAIFDDLKLPRWISILSKVVPNYLWPKTWPHPTAHLNSRNCDGDTPLIVAVRQNQEEVVQALLGKSNINLDLYNERGETPLFVATEQGHRNIAQMLIDMVKDVNVQTQKGDTPLIEAAEKGKKM